MTTIAVTGATGKLAITLPDALRYIRGERAAYAAASSANKTWCAM